MAKVLSSISGNLISAASAGYAPTNSADVSAIASGYQVVSSTGTQLYAGTAYVTSVNGDALSAARAGNAANASMATSAYYDGTGRLISSLPDSAAVSSIASSYAESAASSKADSSALSAYALSSDVSGVIDTVYSNSASWGAGASLPITGSAGDNMAALDAASLGFVRNDTAGEPDIRTATLSPDQLWIDYTLDGAEHTAMMLTESMLDFMDPDGDHIVDAYSINSWNSAVDTVANNSASWGGGATGDYVERSAKEVTIGSANSASSTAFAQGYGNSADNKSFAQGEANSAKTGSFAQGYNNTASGTSFAQGRQNSAYSDSFAQGSGNSANFDSFAQGTGNSANLGSFAQGCVNTASGYSFAQGTANIASAYSFAQGWANTASGYSFAQGGFNSASGDSFAQGYSNKASGTSFAQGYSNSASGYSFAQGNRNSAINTAAVFGKFNLRGDGSTSTGNSAAFVIGDGKSNTARHDLMLVTKDGEITMFSSTADTVGLGLVSSIKAISAAATGGGGDYVEKSATEVAIGSANTASDTAFAQGNGNSAFYDAFTQGELDSAFVYSFAQGWQNLATGLSFVQGSNNSATVYSFAQGFENSASAQSLAQGQGNSAVMTAFAQGDHNMATGWSFAQGYYNSADNNSFAQGQSNSAKNTAAVFGQFNLSGDGNTATGNSAAFAIGDGTAWNARHDLMLVTKDGEITMFSSTADTAGTGIMSSIRAISAAATGGGATLPISGSDLTASATYGITGINYEVNDTSEPNYVTSNVGPFEIKILRTVDGVNYSAAMLTEQGLVFLGGDNYGTVNVDSIASWNSAVDTVSSNSASWGQGGVDSATVSSIASSYAESAASSKLDTTAFNSATFYTTANESGYVGSAYVDSAVSGKMDSSAMTSYALSSDVSGTVDLVSTQSANWGGSALALSAGAGISLTMVGNTLVISTAALPDPDDGGDPGDVEIEE